MLSSLSAQRFLNGNDEYRNNRAHIFPSLVDGPLPIRIIAPPKRELSIPMRVLPTKWISHSASTSPEGKHLYPCLELEMDIISNSKLRGISAMWRRYLKHISLDLALIIDKPTPADPDEPTACVGFFRMDKIDADTCPYLPDRDYKSADSDDSTEGAELQADVRRASQMAIGITKSDMDSIRRAAELMGSSVAS